MQRDATMRRDPTMRCNAMHYVAMRRNATQHDATTRRRDDATTQQRNATTQRDTTRCNATSARTFMTMSESPPDIVGVRDLCPRRLVVGVREVQRRPGAPLDQDPEPRLSQLRHGLFIAVRGERVLRAGEVLKTAARSQDCCIVGGGIGARAHGAARRRG